MEPARKSTNIIKTLIFVEIWKFVDSSNLFRGRLKISALYLENLGEG